MSYILLLYLIVWRIFSTLCCRHVRGSDLEHQIKAKVVFDYTSFLGASCSKKWTFLEAMSTFAPIFSLMWKNTIKDTISLEDRLWDQAMKSLSANRSDESNIITLVELAKSEGIEELNVVMPYELDNEQLEQVCSRAHANVQQLNQDELKITF